MDLATDMKRLEVMFAGSVDRLYDQGDINGDQRDMLIDLLEHIDEYSQDEFMTAWQEVLGRGAA